MSDAVGILISLAVSVVANFITFFALERLDQRVPPVITKSGESYTIEHVRVRGTITTERGETTTVDHGTTLMISESIFVREPHRQSGMHLVVAVAVGAISLTLLLVVLIL